MRCRAARRTFSLTPKPPHSYEKFVAELASKPANARSRAGMSSSDGSLDMDDDEDDDTMDESASGSLLPPAPSSSGTAAAPRTGLYRRGGANGAKND